MKQIVFALIGLLLPSFTFASGNELPNLHLTSNPFAIFALCLFIFSYVLVMSEEFTHLRKSKPVVFVAGLIWAIIAWLSQKNGLSVNIQNAIEHNILEYTELFMFLLVAMTYVNAMEERLVFDTLRSWLVRRGFNYRQLFWVTGTLAFFISPIADNLTTALLLCAVVMAIGKGNAKFVGIACINIVVAANAGGAFSPFGDITTLMVWQDNILNFQEFFYLFFPALASYLLPALLMSLAVEKVQPKASGDQVSMRFGAKRIMLLFLITISLSISFHNFLHLPPLIGMMTGLGLLMFFSYYIKKSELKKPFFDEEESGPFDIFNKIKRAEWDTLFFFYGVIMCVGGLATIGYLGLLSHEMYHVWGANLPAIHAATPANIAVGGLSAIIDNIPVMFAVLTMHPIMSDGQWLLVTLTAGIGGSMLSIGSAAGVALMGQSKGYYSFMRHLKWTWAIALGYLAGIACHIWMNASLF